MLRRALFVFNPYSGKGLIRSKLYDIIDVLTAEEYEVTVYPTQAGLDAFKFISKRAAEFDLLVVGGGDGTLNEAVNGILNLPEENRPILGYIPTGSTNDFASSLSIPKKPISALQNILFGSEFMCDIGKFQKEYFVYVAAFGAFTDVAYATPQHIKNYLGHMAYILEGIKRLPTIKSCFMEVEYDGSCVSGKFIYGMVSNSTFVGGVKSYKKQQVSFNDGLFECVLIKEPQNPIELQSIITGLLMQDFSTDEFCTFRASNIKIKSIEEIDWTLDGEYGGRHTEVDIKNLNKAIKIMIGNRNK